MGVKARGEWRAGEEAGRCGRGETVGHTRQEIHARITRKRILRTRPAKRMAGGDAAALERVFQKAGAIFSSKAGFR